MERLDAVAGFVEELRNETAVVDGVLLLHGAFDSDTLFVDDNDAEHSHVSVDTV